MRLKQQGVGLLDLLIALILIAFGVLALIRYQAQLNLSVDVLTQQNDANLLAINQIETLGYYTTLAGYNAIASGSTTNTTIAANTSYTITTTVTSNTNPTYKVIDVNVTWTDRSGTARNVRQDSIIAWLDPAVSAGMM